MVLAFLVFMVHVYWPMMLLLLVLLDTSTQGEIWAFIGFCVEQFYSYFSVLAMADMKKQKRLQLTY